jgi:hypothetical protein
MTKLKTAKRSIVEKVSPTIVLKRGHGLPHCSLCWGFLRRIKKEERREA